MKATEQTIQQVDRAIRKIAQKFPADNESSIITDIHLRVSQDSGELRAYDDGDEEITRIVVEQWMNDKDDHFFDRITKFLREELKKNYEIIDQMGILKPYSFVLEDEDGEHSAELYIADDDTIIAGGDLMAGLDQDLDQFFDDIMKEKD